MYIWRAALLVGSALTLGAVLSVGSVQAQDKDTQPLSAIDWLSQSVELPASATVPRVFDEPPVAETAETPQITMTPLDAPSPDSAGLLAPAVTGLPRSLWSASDTQTLTTLIAAERIETLPAIQELMVTLMLAEADPPLGAGPDGAMFLARVDKLLDLGALEPAQALLEEAGPDTPELFRRWFDVTLLTGSEDTACALLRQRPTIVTTYPARIFCTARNDDWAAAALTLNTARVLGDVTDEEDALLSRFLDPDLYSEDPPLPPPSRTSPLEFRMRGAIGEGLTTAGLPLAFSHADLRVDAPWRSKIEAAERLARNLAISENTLFGIYRAQTPSASGGVWDRATAVQAFDAALRAGDSARIGQTLPVVWAAMQSIHIEVAFARYYADDLAPLAQSGAFTGTTGALVFRIGLLAPKYEAVALAYVAPTAEERFLIAIARGDVTGIQTTNPAQLAVLAAFAGAKVPDPMAGQIAKGALGEALLRGISLFNQSLSGDLGALTDALALLRSVGMEDVARRAALQYLLLDRQT